MWHAYAFNDRASDDDVARMDAKPICALCLCRVRVHSCMGMGSGRAEEMRGLHAVARLRLRGRRGNGHRTARSSPRALPPA